MASDWHTQTGGKISRVNRGTANAIQYPTRRQWFAFGQLQTDLSPRRNTHCDIEENRVVMLRGNSHTQRVVSERWGEATGGCQDHAAVCRAQPDQSFPRGQPGVMAGGTKMIGATCAHDGYAFLPCFPDCRLHRHDGNPLARAIVSIQLSVDCRLSLDSNLGSWIDRAGGDASGIARDAVHAVRRLPAEAGLDLHFGDDRRTFRR